MNVQNETECKNLDDRNGCLYSNYLQSAHLPSFGGEFSAFQNWKDCLKRNGEEFHISLENLKGSGLWEARRHQGKSETILNNAHVKSEKKANRGPKPPSFGQYLPAFAPVFAGLMHRRRRRENRPRRQRTTFSHDQTVKLEIEYTRTEYITRARRYELAEMLCLTENQIKIWFQNRRAKEKRIEKAHLDHHLRNLVIGKQSSNFPIPKCPSDGVCETTRCSWAEHPLPAEPESSRPVTLRAAAMTWTNI